jgi:hypothetical protein
MEPQLQYPRENARGLRPRRQNFAKAALRAAGKATICVRRSPRRPRSSPTVPNVSQVSAILRGCWCVASDCFEQAQLDLYARSRGGARSACGLFSGDFRLRIFRRHVGLGVPRNSELGWSSTAPPWRRMHFASTVSTSSHRSGALSAGMLPYHPMNLSDTSKSRSADDVLLPRRSRLCTRSSSG